MSRDRFSHALDAAIYASAARVRADAMRERDTVPYIVCAICEKHVDTVTIEIDQIEQTHSIVVECHGDRDRMVVHYADMARWTPEERAQWEAIAEGRVEGRAFTAKRIGGDGPS